MPNPKDFSFIELRQRPADYLATWMPLQRGKGLTGAMRGGTPSENAKRRLRQGLAGCMVLDLRERDGLAADHQKLRDIAKGAGEALRLYRALRDRESHTRAFEIAFRTQFDERLITDPWKIVGHTETAGWIARGGMCARLDEKIHLVDRRIQMIENTKVLLENAAKAGSFGAMDGGPGEARTRNLDYHLYSMLHIRLVEKFCKMPAVQKPLVTTAITSANKDKRAEQLVMREAKAMGIASLSVERVIKFENARVTLKADTSIGARAQASVMAQATTAEQRTNARVEAERAGEEAPDTIATAKADIAVFLGLEASTSMEIKSSYFDGSVGTTGSIGVSAGATVSGTIRPAGASVAIGAEAFAGMKAGVTGKATFKAFGLELFSETVTADVRFGAGAGASLDIGVDVFSGIKASFGAHATVGVGAGGSSETVINHYNIGLAGQRGGHRLYNAAYDFYRWCDDWQRLDWGELSKDHQQHKLNMAHLNKMLAEQNTILRGLRVKEGIAGQGRTEPRAVSTPKAPAREAA
ncbi:MAG: hypothetical protein AAFV86_17925 [Pseudomonadota bacterium]